MGSVVIRYKVTNGGKMRQGLQLGTCSKGSTDNSAYKTRIPNTVTWSLYFSLPALLFYFMNYHFLLQQIYALSLLHILFNSLLEDTKNLVLQPLVTKSPTKKRGHSQAQSSPQPKIWTEHFPFQHHLESFLLGPLSISKFCL